jgi:hypothetical protein
MGKGLTVTMRRKMLITCGVEKTEACNETGIALRFAFQVGLKINIRLARCLSTFGKFRTFQKLKPKDGIRL